jgi:hypothetical protein
MLSATPCGSGAACRGAETGSTKPTASNNNRALANLGINPLLSFKVFDIGFFFVRASLYKPSPDLSQGKNSKILIFLGRRSWFDLTVRS